MATCPDCLQDVAAPSNRRYGYPFTNCTNCGPRYSIIRDVPYDRLATTMAAFQMCPECQCEYTDPADRRFHAQPNACPRCGPSLALLENPDLTSAAARPDAAEFKPVTDADNLEILREVRRRLHQGEVVAVKGLGGFHLACDAENDDAVRLLRRRKRRGDKPFAVMTPDLVHAAAIALLSPADCAALASPHRPIVIAPQRADTRISAAVAPHNRTLGLLLPYTPLHHLLFADSPHSAPELNALVMTSGNLSEEPIISRNDQALSRLAVLADSFLLHNRDIHTPVDDSIVRSFEGRERVLRRSRGYVPQTIDLATRVGPILACGAELKNTFCLTRDHYAILSQHMGDLENYESLIFFEQTLADLKTLCRIDPCAVAYDLHPEYLSTRFAQQLIGIEKIGVQHHHAHIASCMAENRISGHVIGVAFDGTGYGTDGKIWGGEFLVADFRSFERRAHFRYVPLPGGDTAIRQPWRSALAYLADTFDADMPVLPTLRAVPALQRALVQQMIQSDINTVQTSSCGRLFDAVASLLGLRHQITYEGQAAIELEMVADPSSTANDPYPCEVRVTDDPWELDFRPTIQTIVAEILRGRPAELISARFHNTLAALIVNVCNRLRRETGLDRVCLSGGTFQNFYLLERAVAGLRRSGFEVFLHAQVPPNDGGLSLGQAVIANAILQA